MILLALESSAGSSSAAIWQDGNILSHEFVEGQYGHAERIVSQAHKVMTQAEIKLEQIDFFIGGRGPGSFTGIRTCLAAITGFGIVADSQVFGVNGLSAIGFSCFQKLKYNALSNQSIAILSLSDTRRSSYYCQHFSSEKPMTDNIEDLDLAHLQNKISLLAELNDAVYIIGAFEIERLMLDEQHHKRQEWVNKVTFLREDLDATIIANFAGWQVQTGISLSPATPLYLAPAKVNKAKKSLW